MGLAGWSAGGGGAVKGVGWGGVGGEEGKRGTEGIVRMHARRTYCNCSSMNACVPSALGVAVAVDIGGRVDLVGFCESGSERRKMIPTSLVVPVRVERRSMRASVWARLDSCSEVGVKRRKYR